MSVCILYVFSRSYARLLLRMVILNSKIFFLFNHVDEGTVNTQRVISCSLHKNLDSAHGEFLFFAAVNNLF